MCQASGVQGIGLKVHEKSRLKDIATYETTSLPMDILYYLVNNKGKINLFW